MMKDCPLVVHGKKTNDAKQSGLKLGLASYLPWKRMAPGAREPQLPNHWVFFPFTISTMTDGLLLQFGENIFLCLLLTLCTFLKVPKEIKSISAKQTHTLVLVKLEREAFRQKWNLLRKMG